MPTLQEALADRGLAHKSLAHDESTQPPGAPASVTMGRNAPTRQYLGHRPHHWDVEGYDSLAIGVTTGNTRGEPKPRTRISFADLVLSGSDVKNGLTAAMVIAVLDGQTCGSCRMVFPAGQTSCPDC